MNHTLRCFLCITFLLSMGVQAEVVPVVKKAGKAYLQSYHKEFVEKDPRIVDPVNEKYIDWLGSLFTSKQYDSNIGVTYRSRELLVQIIAMQMSKVRKPVRMSDDILLDSRVLGNEKTGASSMPDKLFPGYTLAGEVFKALMMAQPTADLEIIQRRQSLIRQVQNIEAQPEAKTLPSALKVMRNYEAGVVKLFDKSDETHGLAIQYLLNQYGNRSFFQQAYDQVQNAFWSTVDWSLYALFLASGVTTVVNPFLQERYCSCAFFGHLVYSTLTVGSLGAIEFVEYYQRRSNERTQMNLYRAIRVRTDSLYHYLNHAIGLVAHKELVAGLKYNLITAQDLPDELKLKLSYDDLVLIERFLMDAQRLIIVDPTAETNFLKDAVALLWKSKKLKNTIAEILYQGGKIDTYLAIAARMNKFDSGQEPLSFTKFTGQRPYFKANELWNPILDTERVVTNGVSLGSNTSPVPESFYSAMTQVCEPASAPPVTQLILSGGNTSGKSTLMRAVFMNAIFLSQVFGVNSAKSLETGVFHSAYSHMDKYDPTGEFSSYEGELEHASAVITEAQNLDTEENMLAAFDELLSNTDPEEGVVISCAVLGEMASQSGMISLVSSHYDIQSNLEPGQDSVALVHMHVEKTINNTLVKTYKLRQGQAKNATTLYYLSGVFQSSPDIYDAILDLMEKEDDDE